ncbi:hypothetical protein SAMN05444722_2474 [Rhodovulum sp. ES.010]|uniref:DUF5665 domain-containing protein n=1 Tax=Rhodovulum sp. ES.010 TaxID=1882821 RepID=UPI00092C31CC|nr:DUF5665 domain-containing protein [Rhodovulum sp. ES.010]SIO47925.1 hypothetical protein SAMN05444722_2474 [Rhodovulum sp. ES.010]
MPDSTDAARAENRLANEVAALRREVEALNGQRFFYINGSVWRLMGVQFLRGLAMGLGTVVGATALVSVIAYSLSQIDFIPIIGDWAGDIAREIEETADQ